MRLLVRSVAGFWRKTPPLFAHAPYSCKQRRARDQTDKRPRQRRAAADATRTGVNITNDERVNGGIRTLDEFTKQQREFPVINARLKRPLACALFIQCFGVVLRSLSRDKRGMSFTMEDTLESGWVSVRPNVFEEKEKHKFVFIVAWNDIEGKFAVTCHNRTVQKRTAVRDSLLLEAAEGELTAGRQQRPASDRPPPKSPDRQSNSSRPVARSPSKTSRTAKSGDMEVLDPIPGVADDGPEDLDPNLREDFSWAGLFSFQDMRAAHLLLCAVNSDLEPCLPAFPEEQTGVWSVLFGVPEMSAREMEALCFQLQVYLGHALDTCGWKILSQILFPDNDDSEEYYESLSELRQKGYEDALQRNKRHLQELLERQRAVDSMVELLQLYSEQDEAFSDLVEATTELYHYLLQPFRDMRELAMLRRQQIKISLETERLGPRRVESLRREDDDWQRKAHTAVLSIQDLTVKYFETTARAQKVMHERMRADQRKFGKAAWGAAVERMEKLQYAVSKETLQLMRAKEICLEQRKHGLREEMQGLQGGEDAMVQLDQLEALYYELQLQLYEIQFEILKYEELLLTAQLQSLRRQMSERQEEVVYYDTYESPDAMKATDDSPTPLTSSRDDVTKLQQKTRQLEARRGRITAKKAYLKNKKEICIINHTQNIQQRQSSTGCVSQQALLQEEEEEEEQRISRFSQERQRTLDRLRSFKQCYPGQVTLKSTRLRLAYSRKKTGLTQTTARLEPPQTQATSVQTEDAPAPLEHSAGVPELCRPDSFMSLTTMGTVVGEVTPRDAAHASLPPARELLLLDSSTSPISLPPPPPPPPPPPSLEEMPADGQCQSSSPQQQPTAESPLAPFSARFFDSSQLVNARKKLRKTSSLESNQWRRASSPMDEVLASLKRGSFHLRKAELRVLAPDPDEDDGNNILAQIRKGVKLREVRRQERGVKGMMHDSTDPLTRSIHEALRRIKEASPESDSEDETLPCTDWES
ncbi:junction-mediating and -regulatory protein [Xyrauchen texanus]|uniref:junction-mediating and -regulatory protein n=1 Tax=Xyrauchen texanus TaxID=154827 RepID=UPI002241EE96|nr:junction-mediating and -regulatory protein [Xyrauchen texanus]